MASHPAKIGKYNVEGILGRGGMGVVYKAVDQQIGRYVAIKMINAGGDESLLGRFLQEAKSMGQLTCPNIVTVFDFGEQDGNPYLVMQYLEGSSLESLIQKGVALTFSERLGIIIDVCNGLAYAHQRGVIHRDIKPGNIMVLQDGVNDGMAVIVDFGIARIGGDTRLTRTDQIIGSFHYMAAEQFRQEEPDNRTDVYAIGVVLFQLLTGALPFDAPDTAAMMYQIVHEPPPPLSKYLKEYPIELEAIVGRALAKKREERYASAKDLAFDLMQIQDHLKSETVAQLLRRAEALVEREDWTKAREQLQQAQRIDRQNSHVQKMLTVVHERLRYQQQAEQARALRNQADEAYLDGRYDDALRILEQAVALDASNSDLLAFRDQVRSAKQRATGLRRALRRAEAALQDGDLDEAQSAVNEATIIDPQDTQAKALKVIIAQQAEEKVRQEQVRKLLDEARNQITARKLTAAFTLLKNAEALDPTSNELQTVVRLAMAAREQEKRRAETDAMRQQIEAALNQEDYATAAAKADSGLRKFPQEQSLLKLKALADAQRLRVEQKKFVREQFSAANDLADSGQVRQAVGVLERALQRAPGNSELESLRASFLDRLATEESGQRRQQAVETVLAEGERILQERGVGDALQFLSDRADEYSDSQPFRELYDSVREREALEALDSGLASEPNPARQIQLAEEALRQSPGNRWIQQRVEDLHRLRDQINGVIGRAQEYEAAGRLPEAMREWQQLSGTYPQVPEFETQVRRIASLQKKRTESRSKTAPAVIEPSKPGKPADSLSATRVLDSGVLTGVDLSKAETVSGPVKPPVAPPPSRIEPAAGRIPPPRRPIPPEPKPAGLLSGPKKYILFATAAIVLVVVGYLIFGRGETKVVSVKITTDPAGADVIVGPQKCSAPCDVSLQPGTYSLSVKLDGYEPIEKQLTVATGMKTLPVLELVKKSPPTPPQPPPAIDQGTLIVRANVGGAEIHVDGTLKGLTDASKKFEGKLDVGDHDISLNMQGYEDASERIAIAKGRTSTTTLNLKKKQGEIPQTTPAYFVVQSRPGASVLIDRQLHGTVPPDGHLLQKIDPGRHNIEAKLDGYESWSGSATAESGKQVLVSAELREIAKPKPVISLFTADASSIDQGKSVRLRWQTENANELSIDPIGGVDGSSKDVSPPKTTTYTLIARGPGGITRSESVTVTVNVPPPIPTPAKPPSIDDFEPGSDTIQPGQSTKLFWRTQNAKVSIDPGIGSVEENGNRSVSPSQTTTYTLIARGQGGEVAKKVVTVTVAAVVQPQPPTSDTKCVQRFKDAYESLAIEEVQRVWPSLDSKRRNAIKESFKGAQAIKLDEQQCVETPSGPDTTQYVCSERMTYTINGKRQPPTTNPIEFTCRKTAAGAWVVENRIVK